MLLEKSSNLVGSQQRAFGKDVQYDVITSSAESEVEAGKPTKASSRSTTALKPMAKGSQGKTVAQCGPSVTKRLLVAATSVAKPTSEPVRTPRTTPTTTTTQTIAALA